jgi:hypothetical protein
MYSFLPTDYKRPEAPSSYMKLEDGQNKLRIMSAPLLGFMYWNKENKPVRLRMDQQPEGRPSDIRDDEKVKHFWALTIWNYKESRIQILELTQASILGPIEDLAANEDWGDPRNYDITITKKGQKLDTEYSVMPSAPKPAPDEAIAALGKTPVRLEALFEGEDPFTPKDVISDEDSPFPPKEF